jgi:hypothetical protein
MIKIENSHRTFFNLLAAAGMLLSIVAAGCSTTVESQPEAANAVESGGPMPASVTSFFGPDASKLAPGTKGGAALVWASPNAQWATRCSKRDGLLGANDPAALEPIQVKHGGAGAESLSKPPVTRGCTA